MFAALFMSLVLFGAETPPSTATETPEAPATGAETAKTEKPGGDRLVCKRETKPNTRFSSKVCKTVDEWEARAEAARAAFAETQQRPMVSTDKGS